jgi:hypothetical protein
MIDFILKILQVYLLISKQIKGDGIHGIIVLFSKMFIWLALFIAISLLMLISVEAIIVIFLLYEKSVGYLNCAIFIAILNFALFLVVCFIMRTMAKNFIKK